jgi:hypothetical protein
MGACETTPHTSAGNQHATPDNPIATGPSSPLTIFRRLPASSSFVLAAARLRALQQKGPIWDSAERNPERRGGALMAMSGRPFLWTRQKAGRLSGWRICSGSTRLMDAHPILNGSLKDIDIYDCEVSDPNPRISR